jgi:glycosyltransferase involved in cell wall biosynthesis
LLRAVGKLATEKDVQLIVVGKPTAGGPTDRLAGELALGSRVKFVHGITDDEVAALTASAEIAVVPSLYEGFSLPAVEHMASGTPLVVSRTGALPEVVGDAAVLTEPGDPEELAATLRDLLDAPERRAALSQAAWHRVQERFTWSAVARAVVGEYHRTIAAARGAGTEPSATTPRGQGPSDGDTGALRPSAGRPPEDN